MMPASTAPLTTHVIIVNYGTADLAAAAVDSVLHHSAGRSDVQVHLVDNASPGDDAAQLETAQRDREWGARVTLYLETENHGFGRGNNLVLHKLDPHAQAEDRALLLNPDAVLDNDVLAKMETLLDAQPNVGLVGAGISKPCGTQVTAAFRFPNITDSFASQLRFGPVTRMLRRRQVPLPPDHPQGLVDWVAGAAVMMRMQTLRDAGFFDPTYFLYYEEVDLMRQAARAGWQTWYLPQARVIHAEGAATGVKSGETQRKRKPAYWYASWRHYHHKNMGRGRALLAGLAYLGGNAGHHLIATLRRQPIQSPSHVFADVWRHVLRPLLTEPTP